MANLHPCLVDQQQGVCHLVGREGGRERGGEGEKKEREEGGEGGGGKERKEEGGGGGGGRIGGMREEEIERREGEGESRER